MKKVNFYLYLQPKGGNFYLYYVMEGVCDGKIKEQFCKKASIKINTCNLQPSTSNCFQALNIKVEID